MAINLTHAVIHSFSKEAHTFDIGNVTKKHQVLDVTKSAVISLASGVNGLLGKPGNILSYGQFGDDMRQGRFPSAFDRLFKDDLTDAAFLALSHLTVDELVDQASKENLATGGRILVAAYESDLRPFLLVAMIKERGGIQLDEDYVPIEIVEIDLSKVYQAARINVARYLEVMALPAEQADAEEEADRTYLAFLGQGTHNQASGYFVKALGCTKGIASSRATNNVLKAVNDFFIDPDLKPHRAKARFAVQCYLEKQLAARTDAVLTDIAHAATAVLADNQANFVERFKEYLNSEQAKVPAVFPVHAQTLKKSTKIKAESSGWSALFDRRLLGSSDKAEVYFNSDAKTLTFKVLDEATVKEIETELNSRT